MLPNLRSLSSCSLVACAALVVSACDRRVAPVSLAIPEQARQCFEDLPATPVASFDARVCIVFEGMPCVLEAAASSTMAALPIDEWTARCGREQAAELSLPPSGAVKGTLFLLDEHVGKEPSGCADAVTLEAACAMDQSCIEFVTTFDADTATFSDAVLEGGALPDALVTRCAQMTCGAFDAAGRVGRAGCRYCGNGVIEAEPDALGQGAESCDDGDRRSGNGCSESCAVELGWTCAPGPDSKSICQRCGNSIREGTEVCDDGNESSLDGCNGKCLAVEEGFACAAEGGPCAAICGDGLRKGTETCDDSNTLAGDGCSATCAVEAGWLCDAMGVCRTICGDGLIAGAEVCDDGARSSGDGCNATCTAIEEGFRCPNVGQPCHAICGDGRVRRAEACDDGNQQSLDGCSADCRAIESGFDCPETGGGCAAVCGNGQIHGAERCDDGNTMNGDGCSAQCSAVEAGYTCTTPGAACTPICGDGQIVAGEVCDDGSVNGVTASGDGCSADCRTRELGFTCPTPGMPCTPTCGDARLVLGEVCDDGNTRSSDGCSGNCRTVEVGFVCTIPGQRCTTVCGDGRVISSEACDDGNVTPGDGCSATCTVEANWSCTGANGCSCNLDNYEPNDIGCPTTGSCWRLAPGQVTGRLSSSTDVDRFVLEVTDTRLLDVRPNARISTTVSAATFELCIGYTLTSTTHAVACSGGQVAGNWCCETGAAPAVALTGVETRANDSGVLVVRVQAPPNAPAPICAPYTLHLDDGP